MSKPAKIVRLPRRREWKAAKVDLIRSDWPTWSRPPDADIRYGLRVLRSRARHEAQNNDHARQFLREVKSNVIGPEGVRLQNKAREGTLPDNRGPEALQEGWRECGTAGASAFPLAARDCNQATRAANHSGNSGDCCS